MTSLHNLRMKYDETYALAAEGMTPARRKKAMELAQDTLYQLTRKSSRWEPKEGAYLAIYDKNGDEPEPETALQKLLKSTKQPCEVCALGSMFCTLVLKENKATYGDADDGDTVFNRLSGIFTAFQIRLIEAAFEGNTEATLVNYPKFSDEEYEIIHKTTNMFSDYDDLYDDIRQASRDILIKIMLNIITNDGVFVPQ